MGDWITTANGIIVLITGLLGLIGTGIGAFFTVKGFLKAAKEKSANEIWTLVMSMADAAIKEAEKSKKSGQEKKQMVIESVKAACLAGGIDVSAFLDQLSAYIDQCISFANSLNKKK